MRVISLAFSAFGCFFGSRVVVVEELVIAFASGIVVLMTMMSLRYFVSAAGRVD